MIKTPLINKDDVQHATKKLSNYYDKGLIPAEKKTYLTDLKNSTGPYMGIESAEGESHFLMDAASQIATLGLGFNSSTFFGTAHHLESWLNNPQTENFKALRKGFNNFLKRKTGWSNLFFKFCHSGAEANEMALGFCYKKRIHKNAKKVLAFEGSFHGRMMVSLASTWNKSKREPFEWPGYQTEFCPYPELEADNILASIPQNWRELWDQAPHTDFKIPEEWNSDKQIRLEVDCLLAVREKLLSKEIFSIIIEPMQCEGGDRYATDRFHNALLLMARSFKIPIIYDEVQTGYHLGREFFWFRQFQLEDVNGKQLSPDYIVCAKKAQVGLVISHTDESVLENPEEFQVASVIRGYYHALMLDQYQTRIKKLEEESRSRLKLLIEKYSQYISRPRSCGLSFAFDVNDKEKISEFVGARFDHGLLYYPAGAQTLRFRLNTGFSTEDLDFLFERLDCICRQLFLEEKYQVPAAHKSKDRGITHLYAWHEYLLDAKLKTLKGEQQSWDQVWNQLKAGFRHSAAVELVLITKQNFSSYADKIEKLQQRVYEPTRQTPVESFEKVANSPNGIALAIERDSKLMGITFASPLKEHPLDRGTRQDPYFEDESSLYMLDVTIDGSLRGLGLGKSLKYALSLLALVKGCHRIQGRNRDRLAAEMLNINISLGAYELFYRQEDYPDFEEHRDVLYYTLPINWQAPYISLSQAITAPNNMDALTKEYIAEQLPYINNKVCLSNFVSERFLKQVESTLNTLPDELRHAYTTSGQSECVDKLAKSLWLKREKGRDGYKQLTFEGHYFGAGSFLSRSLSNPEEDFFPTTRLPAPNESNFESVLKDVEKEILTGSYLAIWLEPLLQRSMQRVPIAFLEQLKHLATKYKVPVIYNETASQMYRYNPEGYYASEIESIRPSAGMAYLGGQAGIVFVEQKFFVEKPLMLISTWDGDEFSFSNYNLAATRIKTETELYLKIQKEFTETLTNLLKKYHVSELDLKNGVGSFIGDIPHSLSHYFNYVQGRYLVCPSFDSMEHFLKETQL